MALGALPALGQLRYGGFTFNETTFMVAGSIRPVPDQARRTAVHSVYSYTFRTVIAGALPTDAVIQAAVAELTKPGQPFTFTGRGLGDLRINIAGKRDVVWGPWAEITSVRPYGAGRATELTWKVDVAVPTCADGVTQGIMEFNFKLKFDLHHGWTKRTYEGFLRIANNRAPVGGRLMMDSADLYRERIVPPVPVGFRPLDYSFVIDESKSRLDFVIPFEELPRNAPPAGVIRCTGSHEYATQKGVSMWTGTITAEYEMVRDVHPNVAIRHFVTDFAPPRIDLVLLMLKNEGLPPLKPGGRLVRNDIRPYQYRVSEPSVFGPNGGMGGDEIKISMTYLIGGVGLLPILLKGGLWFPVGTSAKEFAAAAATAHSPRGYADLRFNTNEDSLVDLCEAVATPNKPNNRGKASGPVKAAPFAGLEAALAKLFPPPTLGGSWLHYECWTKVSADPGTVVANALPPVPLLDQQPNPGAWDVMDGVRRFPVSPGVGPLPPLSFGGVQVQQRVTPTLYVTLMGRALRVGYPVPCPTLTSIDGAAPRLVTNPSEGFVSGITGALDYPIFSAAWSLTYVAAGGAITTVPTPPNISMT